MDLMETYSMKFSNNKKEYSNAFEIFILQFNTSLVPFCKKESHII